MKQNTVPFFVQTRCAKKTANGRKVKQQTLSLIAFYNSPPAANAGGSYLARFWRAVGIKLLSPTAFQR
jgi:hypothetical protein